MTETIMKYFQSFLNVKSSFTCKLFSQKSRAKNSRKKPPSHESSSSVFTSFSDHSDYYVPGCGAEKNEYEEIFEASFRRESDGALLLDCYEIIDQIAAGQGSKIFLAEDRNEKEMVALKVVRRSNDDKAPETCIQNEIDALNSLSDINVLHLKKVYHSVVSESNVVPFHESTVLVLEHCAGGDFFELVMQSGYFSEILARTYFIQLVRAIGACHDRNLYHRDIKLQNILLDKDFNLKLADFGVCAQKISDSDLCDSVCGTFGYMAPEVLSGLPYSGEKADSWSLGVLLFYLLSGNPPMKVAMKADWWFNALFTKRYDDFWESHAYASPNFPDEARDIVSLLLCIDPNERASARDILKHPWLRGPTLAADEIHVEMSRRLNAIQSTIKVECKYNFKGDLYKVDMI